MRVAGLVAVGLLATMSYGLLSDDWRRGAALYAGYLVPVCAFEVGLLNLRAVTRHLPGLTMAVALGSYLGTAIFLAVLFSAFAETANAAGFGIGMFIGVSAWLAAEIKAIWFRPDGWRKPVNISTRDGNPSSTQR